MVDFFFIFFFVDCIWIVYVIISEFVVVKRFDINLENNFFWLEVFEKEIIMDNVFIFFLKLTIFFYINM